MFQDVTGTVGLGPAVVAKVTSEIRPVFRFLFFVGRGGNAQVAISGRSILPRLFLAVWLFGG